MFGRMIDGIMVNEPSKRAIPAIWSILHVPLGSLSRRAALS
jgi:hypothetical protein